MRISDWSSDVCSSDLAAAHRGRVAPPSAAQGRRARAHDSGDRPKALRVGLGNRERAISQAAPAPRLILKGADRACENGVGRSEEHTSELQSLMRTSYDVFCLHKKNNID